VTGWLQTLPASTMPSDACAVQPGHKVIVACREWRCRDDLPIWRPPLLMAAVVGYPRSVQACLLMLVNSSG